MPPLYPHLSYAPLFFIEFVSVYTITTSNTDQHVSSWKMRKIKEKLTYGFRNRKMQDGIFQKVTWILHNYKLNLQFPPREWMYKNVKRPMTNITCQEKKQHSALQGAEMPVFPHRISGGPRFLETRPGVWHCAAVSQIIHFQLGQVKPRLEGAVKLTSQVLSSFTAQESADLESNRPGFKSRLFDFNSGNFTPIT